MKNHPLFESQQLSIGYRSNPLIREISISVESGSVVGVLGRNGSGKSTFLKTCLGLLPTIVGTIKINQKYLHEISGNVKSTLVSAVLQEKAQKALKVEEVLMLGRLPYQQFLSGKNEKDLQKIHSVAKELKIQGFLEKRLSELSDGERQKVMIARALVQDTPLIIMDEPTVFLDVINAVEIFQLIKDSAEKNAKTWIFSTHQLEMAMQVCSHLLIFDEGKYYYDTTENIKSRKILSEVYGKSGVLIDDQVGRIEI